MTSIIECHVTDLDSLSTNSFLLLDKNGNAELFFTEQKAIDCIQSRYESWLKDQDLDFVTVDYDKIVPTKILSWDNGVTCTSFDIRICR